VFINCEDEDRSGILRYSEVDIVSPAATDNSGSWAELTVDPPYFVSGQALADDLTVTYTVRDFEGLTDTCVKHFFVLGKVPDMYVYVYIDVWDTNSHVAMRL